MYGGGGDEASPSQAVGKGSASPGADGSPAGGARRGSNNIMVHTLLPVTVRQLAKAMEESGGDALTIDGQDAHNVTVVGRLQSVRAERLKTTYVVDDGTGAADIHQWSEEGQDAEENTDMSPGTYVRVVGSVKKDAISSYSIRPITDYNEVTYHFLECLSVHLSQLKKKGLAVPVVKAEPSPVSTPGPTPAKLSQYTPSPPAANGAAGGKAESCNDQVAAVFNDPAALNAENGFQLDEVVRKLGNSFTRNQIQAAIDYLVRDGQLYSTVDESHWKSCAA